MTVMEPEAAAAPAATGRGPLGAAGHLGRDEGERACRCASEGT
jgi:hypothetical protein